jgi:hypothetical protein
MAHRVLFLAVSGGHHAHVTRRQNTMARTTNLAALFLAGLAGAAATGCVGTLDQMPPGDDDPDPNRSAREIFDDDVQPKLETECQACHEGAGAVPYKFMGQITGDDDYDTIVNDASLHGGWDPVAASLLIKGVHDGGRAPALSSGAGTSVRAWLAQEAIERPDPPINPTGPQSARDALAQFSACMTEATWNTAGLSSWANHPSDGGGCGNCHAEGAGAFIADVNSGRMFELNRREIFIETMFKGQQVSGTWTVVPSLRICNKKQAAGHPGYACDTLDTDVIKITNFVNMTNATIPCANPPAFPEGPIPPPGT